jgi:4-amino-4-deoxy-L-arabinose transferase-like glycosyltransferase
MRVRVRRDLLLLILITTVIRLVFAAAMGLGVDESYMVAAGRALSRVYFDHPPAAWWLSWGAAHLFGTEAPIAVRLPFVLLFALTTWLVARLTEEIADRRAGFFAALTLNISPVFGVTTATWVLPDGPLDCALIGAAFCLIRALPARGSAATRWWIGAGVCAGLASLSKYSAALTVAGAFLFLTTNREYRIWLRRSHPWLAALIAIILFHPVVIWNLHNNWASFVFQGARMTGLRFRPWDPFVTLGGELLFVLPWFGVPMILQAAKRFRTGWRQQLLAYLAAPPIVIFPLISAWSSQRILFHWSAPGFLMLFPFLGFWVADRWDRRSVRVMIVSTAALTLIAVLTISLQTRFDLLRPLIPANDPTAEGVDWTSLRDDLNGRGLLSSGAVVGVANWRDGGKIAVGLGPDVPVICLNADARQFGFANPPRQWAGADVLLLIANDPDHTLMTLRPLFSRIDPLPPSAVTLRGRTLRVITVARGIGLVPR